MTSYYKIGEDGIYAERHIGSGDLAKFTPVVVIDPEDREQVEHLLSRFASEHLSGIFSPCLAAERTRAMQAALRSLIAPPRPEEPAGLGAVVEDADGQKWLRVAWTPAPWCKANPVARGQDYALHGTHVQWDGIDAPRVLSEGWSE